MLSCQDCEKYLPVFLDQALEVKESLDVQEHLQSCVSCTHLAEAEQTLRQFVREHAIEPLPQEALKRRIVRQAIQQSAWQSWWSRLQMMARPWDFALGAAHFVLGIHIAAPSAGASDYPSRSFRSSMSVFRERRRDSADSTPSSRRSRNPH